MLTKPILAFSLFLSLAADEFPLIFADDFSKGSDHWKPTDPEAWAIKTFDDGNAAYHNRGDSKYQPPHRSPFNLSLLENFIVGDFELTARVMSTQSSRAHRDMCLFFGYQNDRHFYYVHLGEKQDDHSNQIFIVNDAPRIKITEKTTRGTPWKDDTWHQVKVVRKISTGLIAVFFDDMETPIHVAHDKNFTWGQIGLGTFDDHGLWDDVKLRGVEIKTPPSDSSK